MLIDLAGIQNSLMTGLEIVALFVHRFVAKIEKGERLFKRQTLFKMLPVTVK